MSDDNDASNGRMSRDSDSSVSTTSLVFEHISERLQNASRNRRPVQAAAFTRARRNSGSYANENNVGSSSNNNNNNTAYMAHDHLSDFDDDDPLKAEDDGDLETGPFLAGDGNGGERGAAAMKCGSSNKRMDRTFRRVLIGVAGALVVAWLVGLGTYLYTKSYRHPSQDAHDPEATSTRGTGKKITMDQIRGGMWSPVSHNIRWIAGANDEDGLLIEVGGGAGKDYIVVEDVRAQNPDAAAAAAAAGGSGADIASSRTLMKNGVFMYKTKEYRPAGVKPSRDLSKVLLWTASQSNWRHSFTASYWIFDVATQTAEPLIPDDVDARVQNAQWSPTSDAVAFTRDNNLYVRRIGIGSKAVTPITRDGGPELFYGVPDWVYEEEVIGGASTTWWSEDGKHIAFMRTNETGVPSYPIQYFMSRPSRTSPKPGEETYPEVREIKYPRAGAHNPVVDLQFYDMSRGDVFSVDITGGFADDDRLITTVVWAGQKVLIKETNRVSDVMRVVAVDVSTRKGQTVRTMDVGKLDGGWFEISQRTRYVPADPSRGRPHDGYIDTVVHANGDHLAYFTPVENPDPVMLTSGPGWEVVDAPSAVDLENNLVYFLSTKDGSTQRHVYSVRLDGTGLAPFTNTSSEGYYGASFSAKAGYVLLSYAGPKIPWQKVLSTLGNPVSYEHLVESNPDLSLNAQRHELPLLNYGTLKVEDGTGGDVEINYLERRPPHFSPKKRYPVLFYQYSGPGSQSVTKSFKVDFQSYLAAALGYIVITVDGRGTGFIGRSARVVVRGKLGHFEAQDQIAAAKHFASLPYVDESRMAIWGWSYGGFQTLKTLEQDAGRTFSYGMAVAPVTDWRFYDSIYTERYMLTPQQNDAGYTDAAVTNVTALSQNVRFLLMHGVADDNVHMQNSLTLLDELDLAGVENYDVHVFPDSDHGIYFHNANRIVYDKLENWLVNAFNGEWLKIMNAKPNDMISSPADEARELVVEEVAKLRRRWMEGEERNHPPSAVGPSF